MYRAYHICQLTVQKFKVAMLIIRVVSHSAPLTLKSKSIPFHLLLLRLLFNMLYRNHRGAVAVSCNLVTVCSASCLKLHPTPAINTACRDNLV